MKFRNYFIKTFLATAILLAWPFAAQANVILPPLFMSFNAYALVVGLLLVAYVESRYYKKHLIAGKQKVFLLTLKANIFSTLLGFVPAFFIDAPVFYALLFDQWPEWLPQSFIFLWFAGGLYLLFYTSYWIEHFYLSKKLFKDMDIDGKRLVFRANLRSYGLIFVSMVVIFVIIHIVIALAECKLNPHIPCSNFLFG